MPLVTSNFMELDTKIYNYLLDIVKSKHKLLKHFKILYPEKVPVSMINAIYVGRLETNIVQDSYTTFDSNRWKVSIEIIITTKDNPKLERRKLLKSTVAVVKELLIKSGLDISVKSIVFEYDNTNVIQQARIRVEGTEYDIYREEMEYLKICKVLEEIELIPDEKVV